MTGSPSCRAWTSSCTNLIPIAVTAPRRGWVTITAEVVVKVQHVSGTADSVNASITRAIGSCDDTTSVRMFIPAEWPTGTYYPRMTVRRRLESDDAASLQQFYVNGFIAFGSAAQTLHSAGVTATYSPD